MKTKFMVLMSSLLVVFSVVSCLKTIEEEEKNEIIIPDENFDTNTQNITVKNPVSIAFSDGQTIVSNPYEKYGVRVSADRQNVTITSTTSDLEFNYVLSGKTTDGFVKIYSSYKFGLVLNGVSILNPTGAAINIQSGKKVSVRLVDKTSNRLIDKGVFQMTAGEDMKGTLFSEGQLIFDGSGSLEVYGNYGHAICVDDYIQINSGNITVSHAAKDGIHSNQYFQMDGGNVVIQAKSDGVDCPSGYITINGGAVKINSSGGDGLKSSENIAVYGGQIEIESRDNGVKTNRNIVVNGGEIYCNSSKQNGISSDEGTIAIAGGLVVVSATDKAFDCNQTFSITGGTAIGTGRATTMPTSSTSRQHSVVVGASNFKAGQLISMKSSDNSEALTFKFSKAYSGNMELVYTSLLLKANTAYTIYKDGVVSGGNDFHGLYSGAVSSGGTALATFTTVSLVTLVGK